MCVEQQPLSNIPTGARVKKLTAIRLDFAFGRTGSVIRESFDGREHVGVLWDGGGRVYEYPDDCLLAVVGVPT